jgi:hypothetical protein
MIIVFSVEVDQVDLVVESAEELVVEWVGVVDKGVEVVEVVLDQDKNENTKINTFYICINIYFINFS